jgi:hypothetical protein
MGLPEKRLVKLGQEEITPKHQAKLQEITSHSIAYEVDWASFANDRRALENLEFHGFDRIESAFRTICHDMVGRDAVKEVHRISIRNVEDPQQRKIAFHDGAVEIHGAYGKGHDGAFIEHEIVETLEKVL